MSVSTNRTFDLTWIVGTCLIVSIAVFWIIRYPPSAPIDARTSIQREFRRLEAFVLQKHNGSGRDLQYQDLREVMSEWSKSAAAEQNENDSFAYGRCPFLQSGFDAWGSPFNWDRISESGMKVSSNGPDRKNGTSDDFEIIIKIENK